MRLLPNPRICLLTETYHPVVGGGETQARSLAEGLAQQGWEVLVLTRRSDAGLPLQEMIGGVPVYRIWPSGAAHWKKWGLLLSSGAALWRLRRRYDLIFVSGFRVVGMTAVLLAKLLGKRVILKADSLGEMSGNFFAGGLARFGLCPTSFLFRAFLGLRNGILRRADRFVAISTVVTEELTAHGVLNQQIEQIPNSVDTSRFHPVSHQEKQALRRQLDLPAEAQIVVFAGRLVSYKGLPLLLKVWRTIQVQYGQAYLLLIGAGGLDIDNCEAELREYAATHQLQVSVRFTGSVSNMPSYLQAADIFVFPTENEAFGIALIEAMACGLAPIGTAVGGVKDILENDRNGLVIPPNDFERLLAALTQLFSDAALCVRLGIAALQTVQTRYTTARVNQHYAQLFTTSVRQQSNQAIHQEQQ